MFKRLLDLNLAIWTHLTSYGGQRIELVAGVQGTVAAAAPMAATAKGRSLSCDHPIALESRGKSMSGITARKTIPIADR